MTESRVRRQFTDEFKREAVQLVEQQGLSFAEAARRLDVRENLLRRWRQQFSQAAGASPAGTQQTALEAENRRLRAENARLLMEREILKKATAFFARESK